MYRMKLYFCKMNSKLLYLLFFHFILNIPNKVCSQTTIENNLGEEMKYLIHYGFIHAAEAKIGSKKNSLDSSIEIYVKGETTGLFSLISPVQDEWHAFINPKNWRPYKTSFKKREINYRKSQTAIYDYQNDKVNVEDIQNEKIKKVYQIDKQVNDMLGVYAEIRNENFKNWPNLHRINRKIFLEDKIYKVIFIKKGQEMVKVNNQSIPANLLIIKFPKNELLSEKEDIRLWVSQDPYQIPLKIEVDLKIGHLSIDLIQYQRADLKIY